MCLQTVWTALTTISFISPVGDVVTETITKPEPGRSLHSQVFKSEDILIICPARPSTTSCVLHLLYVCSLMALAHEPAKRRRQSRSPNIWNRCMLPWMIGRFSCLSTPSYIGSLLEILVSRYVLLKANHSSIFPKWTNSRMIMHLQLRAC